jgi:hypothetical protein
LLALVACVAVTGCSSGSGKPAAKSSAAPSSADGGPVSLHISLKKPLALTLTAATNLSPGASATFYGYQQPVSVGRPLDALAQQFVFGVADVSVCLGSKPASLTAAVTDRKSWVLHYANGTIIDPAAIRYPKEPTPVFPFTTTGAAPTAANSCIRGKIVYPVPRTSSPESIVYAPAGFAGTLTFRFR